MSEVEQTDKHDTEPCKVSPRSVDAVIGELREFLSGLEGAGYEAGDLFTALQHEAHALASSNGYADQLLWIHEGLLVESHDAFICVRCDRCTLNAFGAADDQPDVCDDCYQPKGAA